MTPQPEQRSHRDEGRRPFRASGACTAVPPSAAASVFTFTFNERVVVRSTATLKAWQDVDYGAVPTDSDVKSNVWLQDGPNIVFAKTISGRGTATRMSEVSWYRRDPTGVVTEIIHAPLATYAHPRLAVRSPDQLRRPERGPDHPSRPESLCIGR
jgi:hypothetical protein